jgi:uncharacterized membrane protein YfcA
VRIPGILAGTFFGTWVAARSTGFLKWFFVAFLCFVAVQMLLDESPGRREIPASGTGAVGGSA